MALLVGLFVLIGGASLLGGHGKRQKHYFGFTSAPPYNGFSPSVTFTVSRNGSRLSAFQYQTLGCFSDGPQGLLQKGKNYYAQPGATIKLGNVAVAGDSTFAARSVMSTHTSDGISTDTTTSVSGRFTLSGAASGLITFAQERSGTGTRPARCGPVTVRLNANST